jgi:aspartate-semialdehyde dehydrogenase
MKKLFNVAVVGATGLVGRTMIKVLEERNFPVGNLFLLASERSAGTIISFRDTEYIVSALSTDSFEDIDIALFSAGKDVSVKYAPIAAACGCVVIDNGSYWRMHPDVPLVVPEVNPDAANNHNGIIANPNCSTIQLMVALKPIEDNYKLKRVIVSTYQSITGAGQKGIDQLTAEISGEIPQQRASKHQIAYNTVFHTVSDPDGFSEEEIKMINEPRKILSRPDLPMVVTCVRLPILGGHGESVNIETEKSFDIDELRKLMSNSPGITVVDSPLEDKFPTPVDAGGHDGVFVGRLRKDTTVDNGAYLWVVSDNVRKGAATNAVQIAELLIEKDGLDFEHKEFKY